MTEKNVLIDRTQAIKDFSNLFNGAFGISVGMVAKEILLRQPKVELDPAAGGDSDMIDYESTAKAFAEAYEGAFGCSFGKFAESVLQKQLKE